MDFSVDALLTIQEELEIQIEWRNRENAAHDNLKVRHKQEYNKFVQKIAKLERQLEDKARELKEKSQSLTLLEKQKTEK